MNEDRLQQLRIASERKRGRGVLWGWILLGVAVVSGIAVYFAVPRASDSVRLVGGAKTSREDAVQRADKQIAQRGAQPAAAPDRGGPTPSTGPRSPGSPASGSEAAGRPGSDASVLTASGYIVSRERIEISPRFMGVVLWIGVRKGDSVTNGQVVVRLDDSEYRARMAEIEGQIGVAKVAAEKAGLDLKRAEELVRQKVEMQKVLDDARLQLASATAQIRQLEGTRQLVQTWLDWCVIRSPVNGVVLERMVDPSELVSPQTFGGTRGPSTSLLAVADLNDLQVEIDLNEADLAKVSLGQSCRVSPEAYPDRSYEGVVAEIAPEASRQKGTLQIKVQVHKPDRFLTPELSAKVQFLSGKAGAAR